MSASKCKIKAVKQVVFIFIFLTHLKWDCGAETYGLRARGPALRPAGGGRPREEGEGGGGGHNVGQ